MTREIKLYKGYNRLQGPVIDWCNRLHDTEVQSLDLYISQHIRPTGLGSSVVAKLLDGSRYCLKRKVKSFQELIPEFVDTIEPLHISHPVVSESSLVNIQFKSGSRPSLQFILAVCHGVQTRYGLFRASEVIAGSDFFALAITLSVARKCINHRTIAHTPTSTGSPLKRLWRDVHDFIQNEDYTFWGDTIAEHTKNITRELVYKSARKNVAALLHCNRPQYVAASVVSRVEVLARRKELSEPTLWDEAWDKHWQEVWCDYQAYVGTGPAVVSTSSSDRNVSGRTLRLDINGRTTGGIAGRTISKIPVTDGDTILLDVLLKGLYPELDCSDSEKGKANRDEAQAATNLNSPISDPSPTNTRLSRRQMPEPKIWPGYGLVVIQDQGDNVVWASPREMAVEMAWEKAWDISVAQGEQAAKNIQEKNNGVFQQISTDLQDNPQNTDLPTPVGKAIRIFPFQKGPSRPTKAVSLFINNAKRRSRIGHPQNNLGLELLPETPPQPAQPAKPNLIQDGTSLRNSGLPRILIPPKEHPSIPTADTSASKNIGRMLSDALLSPRIPLDPDDKHAFQLSIQERRYLERKEAARVQAKEAVSVNNSKSKRPKPPNNGSEGAWELINPGLQSKPTLEDLAEQEVQKLLAQSGQSNSQNSSELATKSESIRKGFMETWERAWKESWDAAWGEVWETTWNAAVARGVEFGAELVLDHDPDLVRGKYEQLQTMPSYEAMEASLEHETCLGTLEQFRIMMKELYHLYELLHHSVSDSRNNRIDITVTRPRKSARESSTENESKSVSYFELQKWIEEEFIDPKFGGISQAHAQRLFKRGIAEVWNSISRIGEGALPINMSEG
ncbi:unnamed protein product [Rhizoctonia solani]|uniref:Uncharacterized protein n=1 Tax=Rhizoctonia solani TaxID=456999 RepID=A0A8H3CIN0_9AGAM|nr:unnamed protein product [Rhizoctonia solani]